MRKPVVGMSKAALARKARVSATTVDTWVSKGVPSVRDRTGKHYFNWQAVSRWRSANMPPRPAPSEGLLTYSLARARKETALAGLRELQLRQRQESLGDIALIRASLEGVMIHQRTILLGVPAQIGREIDDPEIRMRVVQLVDRRVREALEALSNYDPVVTTAQHAGGPSEEERDYAHG